MQSSGDIKLEKILHSDSLIEQDGYIYISDSVFNGLYRANVDKWIVEYIGDFKEELKGQYGLHGKIICNNNQLIFTPSYANYLYEYELLDGIINAKTKLIESNNKPKYLSGIKIKNSIYFLPFETSKIIVLNADDVYNIEYLDCEVSVSHAVDNEGDYIWAADARTNKLLRFNTVNTKSEIIYIENIKTGFEYLVCVDDKTLLLATKSDNSLYKYNVDTGELITILNTELGIESLIHIEKRIIVITSSMKEIYIVKEDDLSVDKKELVCKGNVSYSKVMHINDGIMISDDRLLLATRYDSECTFICIDIKTREIEMIVLERPDIKREYIDLIKTRVNASDLIAENFSSDLKILISNI
ncbi:hypothetical protein [Pseudobutyrivibrio sp.]|jgi:outer membrane protein assembly factor BamB|uniref:hypothetical protein n=1 Tax=Pseudobutyrivibrio sp. TaxID=2014367 RepID=UPI0025E5F1DD|nr:hypothetical protein [Pseudobutyrivibrio sp.]